MNRKNLDEVSLMRPILIVLVVLYHAMAIHTGNWDLPDGTRHVGAYAVIGRLAYIFMLESFVFMSGYVWAFQHERKAVEPFVVLLKKKAKRLLVPCWVFGLLYAILFGQNDTLGENFLKVATGIGHLWFLFMLFACFIITWGILRVVPETKWGGVILCLSVLSVFSFFNLPFQLSNIMYYLLFFFVGYRVCFYRERIYKDTNWRRVLWSWILFAMLYVGLSYLRSYCIVHIEDDIILEIVKKACRIGYAIAGMMAFYLTSVQAAKRTVVPKWYFSLGTMCFGVYIFQQFFLHVLFYNTSLPALTSPIMLPLLSFVLSLFASLTFTWLVRQFEIGRNYL